MNAGATGSFIAYNRQLSFLKSISDTSAFTLQTLYKNCRAPLTVGTRGKHYDFPMKDNKKHPITKHWASGSFLPFYSFFLSQNETLPTDNVSTLKRGVEKMAT